jgi:hypothetical protein
MITFNDPKIITYKGEPINDWITFNRLPGCVQDFLIEINGFTVRNNVYHIRGCVNSPDWHSLNEVWHGETKLSDLFNSVSPYDIPIAQDCTGNQFIIRQNRMYMLDVETDSLVLMKINFQEFIRQIAELSYDELQDSNMQNVEVAPGQHFSYYPIDSSVLDFSLKAFDALAHLKLLSMIARSRKNNPGIDQLQLN